MSLSLLLAIYKINNLSISDFIAVGTKIRLPKTVCHRIIEEVADNCGKLLRYKLK